MFEDHGPAVFGPGDGQHVDFAAGVVEAAFVGADGEEGCPPFAVWKLEEVGVAGRYDWMFAVTWKIALGEDRVVFPWDPFFV